MSEEMLPQVISQLFVTYGPPAFPIIGLLLIVKYLLDKDKQRETTHKTEIEAERAQTAAERKRGDDFQMELLRDARGNAMLAEELKAALQSLAGGKS